MKLNGNAPCHRFALDRLSHTLFQSFARRPSCNLVTSIDSRELGLRGYTVLTPHEAGVHGRARLSRFNSFRTPSPNVLSFPLGRHNAKLQLPLNEERKRRSFDG